MDEGHANIPFLSRWILIDLPPESPSFLRSILFFDFGTRSIELRLYYLTPYRYEL